MCIVVTGAAKGIGRAVAELLAPGGSPLVLVDSDEPALTALAFDLSTAGHQVAAVPGSVADEDTALRAAHAAAAFGGATGLSHNAGIQRYGNAITTDPAGWDEVMDVNLRGAWLMAHALLPQIVHQGGACVFMASVQGLATQQNVTAYTVSKHGLIGLAKSIAVDFAARGVRSNAVAPGSVKTPMLEWSVGLAEVVAFLLSDKASFITGEVLRVDGGLMARLGGSPSKA